MTREQAEAFLEALTELCRQHEVVIRCSGYECEGLDLEDMDVRERNGAFRPDPLHWHGDYARLFSWRDEP